jgi:hypothetical protein
VPHNQVRSWPYACWESAPTARRPAAFVGGLLPAAAETAVEEGDTSLIDAAATGLELALVCDGDIPVAQLVRDHAAELTADDALTLFLRVYAGPRFGELLATW